MRGDVSAVRSLFSFTYQPLTSLGGAELTSAPTRLARAKTAVKVEDQDGLDGEGAGPACCWSLICASPPSPPPLCGATPASGDYVAKQGDKVAARVKAVDGDEQWILAEVVSYNHSTNK